MKRFIRSSIKKTAEQDLTKEFIKQNQNEIFTLEDHFSPEIVDDEIFPGKFKMFVNGKLNKEGVQKYVDYLSKKYNVQLSIKGKISGDVCNFTTTAELKKIFNIIKNTYGGVAAYDDIASDYKVNGKTIINTNPY